VASALDGILVVALGVVTFSLPKVAVGNTEKCRVAFHYKHIKMAPEDIREISGHSIRVGATQDLLALNVDPASVMEPGRYAFGSIPPLMTGPRSVRW
jgi:hypothetical protein